ncbi:putative holin-like toxin [Sporolactobacillus terrae]|nr:putative holin-like toxin [Sporolactobacillus terrae]
MSGCGDALWKGVVPMTVFQAISLMISFGVLVLMLSDRKK